MSQFKDLMDLVQLNMIEVHLDREAPDDIIACKEIADVKNVINYKKNLLVHKIITKSEVDNGLN